MTTEYSQELKKAAYDALFIFNGGCNPLPLLKTLVTATKAGSDAFGYCNYEVIKTEPVFAPARIIMFQMSHLFFGVVPDVSTTDADIKFCEELATELNTAFEIKYPNAPTTGFA